jgi:alkylation response protein AidB-like acyl-CoA dehydrogenase
MHLSIVGPLMESPQVSAATKQRLARLVVEEQKLIAGNFSEPTTSGLVATPIPATRARRVADGYRLSGRKAFASMLEAADYTAVLAYPDEATSPSAAILLLVPRQTPGRRVELVWDTLGMRATCSDSLILRTAGCQKRQLLRSDDIVNASTPRGELAVGLVYAVYLGGWRRIKKVSRASWQEFRLASPNHWPTIQTCVASCRDARQSGSGPADDITLPG